MVAEVDEMSAQVTQRDLDRALADLARIEADSKLRGERPGRYRAALMGARARVERLAHELNGRIQGPGVRGRLRRGA